MESSLKVLGATIGGTVSYLFGGWSVALEALLIFVVIDYITGLSVAAKNKGIYSRTGMYGIARKMLIFAVVAMAHMVDRVLADLQIMDAHMIRDAAVMFYIVNEGISIIENAGQLGVQIPEKLCNAFEVLKERK